MSNLIKYSSNYSETTGSLCFYSKDEKTNYNNNIASTDDFKSFKYKAEFLENTEADGANVILKTAAITMPLKYLRNFWRSVEMPLVNCKVELKVKWAKYCFLSAAGNGNTNANPNNIISLSKTWNSTLSAKDNQKLSKLLSKRFEKTVYQTEFKTKRENKNTTNEYRYFLESNFFGANRLFVLVYSNQDNRSEKIKAKRLFTKEIIDNYYFIINGKSFHDQAIDSDLKRKKKIRKLTAGQGEDYTTGLLLDYDYIKNHYRLIAMDLNRQKELDSNLKAIQQIASLKSLDDESNAVNADGTQSMIILTNLEKIQRNEIKSFSRKCNSIMNNRKLTRSEH